MSEYLGGGAGGGAIIAAGWAGRKLLGPLFDEIADDWRSRYSEHRKRNLNRIGKNAQQKLGSRIDSPGEVPPRVALRIMDEGSWCEAAVMSEYFGGILAASRSETGDDRGVSWAGLVSRLSSPDVLLHYLLYEGFRRAHLDEDINLGESTSRQLARTYFPATELLIATGNPVTNQGWLSIEQSLSALIREDLIDTSHFRYGPAEFLKPDAPGVGDGAVLTPSPAGAELFLWAHGHGEVHVNALLKSHVPMEPVEELPRIDGAISTHRLRQLHAEAAQEEASAAVEPTATDPTTTDPDT